MDLEMIRQIIKYAVSNARQIKDDTEALNVKFLFKEFDAQIGKPLEVGEFIQYNDKLYKVLQPHTAQAHWTPENAPSLFAQVLVNPDGTPEEWVQPDSTNAYMKGDKVLFNGLVYESLIDNNVWSPAAYPAGWSQI